MFHRCVPLNLLVVDSYITVWSTCKKKDWINLKKKKNTYIYILRVLSLCPSCFCFSGIVFSASRRARFCGIRRSVGAGTGRGRTRRARRVTNVILFVCINTRKYVESRNKNILQVFCLCSSCCCLCEIGVSASHAALETFNVALWQRQSKSGPAAPGEWGTLWYMFLHIKINDSHYHRKPCY